MGEQLAGAADAALHLVEDQQQAVLVAELAQRFSEAVGNGRMPPSPCTGSIRIAAVSGRSRLGRVDVAERTWSKPSTFGPKPSRYFCLAAGGDGRQRAAVEGALEGDDAEAFGWPLT
jgi:N-acetylmuramic acid 6-phosphate (MurNAc-6-P) etherase